MEASAGADQEALSLARCLGYLIRELPSRAKVIVADEVLACNADDEGMKDLSQFYINHLIRVFRQNKGQTPTQSEHPSRPSFEMHRAFFSEVAEPAPRDHSTAKSSALKRDNLRCVVTGWVDSSSKASLGPAEMQRYNVNPNSPETYTNYCHIFPPSTNWSFDSNDPEEKKKRYAGTVWAIINAFGAIDVLSELGGEKIHRLENGFTMDPTLHTYFDDLKLWFEEVPNAINTYRVCTFSNTIGPLLVFPPNHIITFTSTDPDLPVPNPAYLNLHAAVCRIAHMSGAAGYLYLEDREIEKLKVLSRDGSSAKFLASRLKSVELRT
ncbi:hypothetical protein CPB84DRAFT_1735519 [Gymnopilus junonius]|uniref:HNH nuclease domain-containing protein n=2 Tax=Gymnopilus junonius TaxID=109634 RepID=A0A9P5NCX1_GYMJU|nr:hypothetical protein CPB84DRAFT_1735519 [Gymnopilus junonius]